VLSFVFSRSYRQCFLSLWRFRAAFGPSSNGRFPCFFGVIRLLFAFVARGNGTARAGGQHRERSGGGVGWSKRKKEKKEPRQERRLAIGAPTNAPALSRSMRPYFLFLQRITDLVFARSHVPSAPRVRENWFLGLTKHGAILPRASPGVNRQYLRRNICRSSSPVSVWRDGHAGRGGLPHQGDLRQGQAVQRQAFSL
jgi:hypothetical protein